jgi:hypothetical protein
MRDSENMQDIGNNLDSSKPFLSHYVHNKKHVKFVQRLQSSNSPIIIIIVKYN